MNKVNVEVNSQVNVLYSKTIVTQRFINSSEEPLKLEIYIKKKREILFSKFNAKIGDSIVVNSKVIKEEELINKYELDSSSENEPIFITEDQYNNNIIIDMGYIPAKKEVIFTSEYIQSTDYYQSYEFELFRHLPIFKGKNFDFDNKELTGKIEIQSKSKINNIDRNIAMKNLKIIEEKYLNEEKNKYLILYKIDDLEKLPKYFLNDSEYIFYPTIFFEIDKSEPIIFRQKSIFENKYNYIIHYNNIIKENQLNFEIFPALFIFVIDLSGSLFSKQIKLASEALKFCLSSLPLNSYYQIFGFSPKSKKNDLAPKECNLVNINESYKIIEKLILSDDFGADIYSSLKKIYNSYELYDKINLQKYIFLLTDGNIKYQEEILQLIERNNSKFSVFSFGLGYNYDFDFIQKAGIAGKGNYHICANKNYFNSAFYKQIRELICPNISNLFVESSLDNKNLIKTDLTQKNLINNRIINLNYITENKEDKIVLEVKYVGQNNKKYEKKYEIIPENFKEGEELCKLINKNYILNNTNLNKNEIIDIALQNQIFIEDTALFAEVQINGQISQNKISLNFYKRLIKNEIIKKIKDLKDCSQNLKGIGISSELINLKEELFEDYSKNENKSSDYLKRDKNNYPFYNPIITPLFSKQQYSQIPLYNQNHFNLHPNQMYQPTPNYQIQQAYQYQPNYANHPNNQSQDNHYMQSQLQTFINKEQKDKNIINETKNELPQLDINKKDDMIKIINNKY